MTNPSRDLKGLQTRAAKINAEIALLEAEEARVMRDLDLKRSDLKGIKQQMSSLTAQQPVVTEHALLRYIERVMGVDLAKIEAEILNEKNRQSILFAGSCRIKAGGIELVVKDRRVISVVAEK